MESGQVLLDMLDDEGVSFDELYQSHLEHVEEELPGLGKPDSVVLTSLGSSNLNTPSPTLASLNAFDTASENLFNLDFEGSFHLDSSADMNRNIIGELDPDIRSPSPMSMTSVSGSEPYSPSSPCHVNVDETDKDLLEYLLQDADIEEINDDDGEKETAENGRQRRHVFTRNSVAATNGGIGLSNQQSQSGPWCKTKNRNSSRNAVAARENRLKKKHYLQELEETNSRLARENAQLKKESSQVKKKMGSLEEEVLYLRKVLLNQSALAGLLKKMNQNNVILSGSVKDSECSTSMSGGVCLHVDGEEASLKFCASCARKDQS